MHLLCHWPECLGNDLPAGTVADDVCRFCGRELADTKGQVLAQGAAPLVSGEFPQSLDALMEALRDAEQDVQLVQMTAVRCGDRLLYSAVSDDGDVIAAGIVDGRAAVEAERSMHRLAEPGR